MTPIWLSFKPAYNNPRGNQPAPLGAHAFREDGPRSLCGSIGRERVTSEAHISARRCVWCERVIAGRSADRSGAPRAYDPLPPSIEYDSVKRFTPGTDPLAPMPYTDAERDEFVRRVRELTRVAASAGPAARTGTRMSPKRLAQCRAERAAAYEQAMAHARSLAGRST